eukprot:366439-Prymnesium_polylepis.1
MHTFPSLYMHGGMCPNVDAGSWTANRSSDDDSITNAMSAPAMHWWGESILRSSTAQHHAVRGSPDERPR